MKLRRKIGKLFTGESLVSAEKQFRRRLTKSKFPLDRKSIVETIDPAVFAKIRQRYENDPAAKRWSKYLDLEHWIDVNLTRIRRTGLDSGRRQRVLDLGCGAGYFVYIARLLGHDCIALDTDDQPMFREINALLGIEHLIWRIEAFKPLPEFDTRFDLVTAYRVCFNNHKQPDLWGVAEWEFFLDDLAKYRAPGSRVWLEFNLENDGDFYTPELREFFLSKNANIRGSRVLFDSEIA